MRAGMTLMPRKLPPFVECWRDRHRRVRVYFRRGKGQRIALPSSIGSDEFNAAYQAALSGQFEARAECRRSVQPGTIAALVVSYMSSDSYLGLRPTTKVGYATRIEALRIKHGHRTIAGLTRERIITGILQPYAGKPGAALSILKMLRILINHAITIGWLKQDPSVGIERPKIKEVRSWTDDELARYEALVLCPARGAAPGHSADLNWQDRHGVP